MLIISQTLNQHLTPYWNKDCGAFIMGLFSSNKAYCKHKGRVPRFQTLFLYSHFPSLLRFSCYCLPIFPTKWKHCLATSILFWKWSSEEHIVKTMQNCTARKNVTHWKKRLSFQKKPQFCWIQFKKLVKNKYFFIFENANFYVRPR